MKRLLERRMPIKMLINAENIFGNIIYIYGNASKIEGDASGIGGDVDTCEISSEERLRGVYIEELINKVDL